MANVYTEEQLHQMRSDEWIPLFLSQQSELALLEKNYNTLDRNVQILMEQLADLKRHRFGRSTERLEAALSGQLSFSKTETGEICFNEAEFIADANPDDDDGEEEVVVKKRGSKKRGKREEDLKGLEVQVVPYRMTEEDLADVFGDEPYKQLPDEIQRVIVRKPAETYVEERHIEVFAGKNSDTMVKADHPKKLLRNSLVSPSLAADILTEKYVKAVPLYRQEQVYMSERIPVTRGNMAHWVIRLSEKYLAPLYQLLHQMLFNVHVLQADETPFLVNKDGRPAGAKSYMWVYRTGSMCTGPPVVLYEYQKTRKSDHPLEFLKDFNGICVTDGYEVYHTVEKKRQLLTIAGCWVHARRKYDEALKALPQKRRADTLAGTALLMIKDIFEAEGNLKSLSPSERLEQRQQTVLPLVDAYFDWLRENQHKPMAGSKTARGMNYSLNQEKYLRVFLTDGEVPMHNNTAEQAIRPFCIGKKNWEFCDTMSGAKASAIVYSIIETAKANGLIPYRYLEHVFSVTEWNGGYKDTSYLADLLPWSDKLPKDCYKVVKEQGINV